MGKLQYSDKQIEAMIKGIEDGSITPIDLPEGYYKAFANYMKKGLYEGFGASLETVSQLDLPLLEQLTTNVYQFSAAKTFQQTQAISALLLNEDGRVRSSREFNKLARETFNEWNDNYGATEYNTAIAQGDNAAKWADIERQKDVMPVLSYSAIGDSCSICAPLDGLTAPVNSPVWRKITPVNHFNCRCLLMQHDDTKELTKEPNKIVDPVVEKMKERKQDMFIGNAGQTGEIFNSDHPYYNVAKEYREFAKQNFNLPIPKFETVE